MYNICVFEFDRISQSSFFFFFPFILVIEDYIMFTGSLGKKGIIHRAYGLTLSLTDFKKGNKDVLCHIFLDHLMRCSDTEVLTFVKKRSEGHFFHEKSCN